MAKVEGAVIRGDDSASDAIAKLREAQQQYQEAAQKAGEAADSIEKALFDVPK